VEVDWITLLLHFFSIVKKERNVVVLAFTVCIILLSLFSWYYLFPLFLKDLGASDRAVGFFYSLFVLGFTLAQWMGGYFADKFGRKKTILWPTYTFPILYSCLAFSFSYLLAGFLYLISNIGSAIQMPAFTAMIAESQEKKGKAFGIFEFYVALGIAFGPLLGFFLLRITGIRTLILMTALVCLLSAVLRHIFLEETIELRRKMQKIEMGKDFILFTIFGIFIFTVFSLTIQGPFLTLFQKEVLLFSKKKINLMFALGNLLGAFVSPFAGRLCDNIGSKKLLIFSALFHPLLVFLWFLFPIPIFFVLFFPPVQIAYLSYQVGITEIVKEETRGRLLGIFGAITGMFSSLGPTIGMHLKLKYGFFGPFSLALFFGILASLFLIPVNFRRSNEGENLKP